MATCLDISSGRFFNVVMATRTLLAFAIASLLGIGFASVAHAQDDGSEASVQSGKLYVSDGSDSYTGVADLDGGTLTKSGNGALTLGGVSTYTGATNINGGTISNNNSSGSTSTSGTLTVAGGVLTLNGEYNSGSTITGRAETLTFNLSSTSTLALASGFTSAVENPAYYGTNTFATGGEFLVLGKTSTLNVSTFSDSSSLGTTEPDLALISGNLVSLASTLTATDSDSEAESALAFRPAVAAVPEPSSYLLVAVGTAGLLILRRRWTATGR